MKADISTATDAVALRASFDYSMGYRRALDELGEIARPQTDEVAVVFLRIHRLFHWSAALAGEPKARVDVQRISLASPLEVITQLPPELTTPAGIAAVLYLVPYAFSLDLRIKRDRARYESQIASYRKDADYARQPIIGLRDMPDDLVPALSGAYAAVEVQIYDYENDDVIAEGMSAYAEPDDDEGAA